MKKRIDNAEHLDKDKKARLKKQLESEMVSIKSNFERVLAPEKLKQQHKSFLHSITTSINKTPPMVTALQKCEEVTKILGNFYVFGESLLRSAAVFVPPYRDNETPAVESLAIYGARSMTSATKLQ